MSIRGAAARVYLSLCQFGLFAPSGPSARASGSWLPRRPRREISMSRYTSLWICELRPMDGRVAEAGARPARRGANCFSGDPFPGSFWTGGPTTSRRWAARRALHSQSWGTFYADGTSIIICYCLGVSSENSRMLIESLT